MRHSYDFTFEHAGRSFGVTVERDDCMGPPWKEHDGHGIVSEWTTRSKAPGERVMVQDRSSYRYYDFQETMKIAKRDGWGPRNPKEGETKGQATARAVEQDFESMRAWCNNEWFWCGVIVELLDSDENPTGETESLWGIESEADDYIRNDVSVELAEQIIGRVDEKFCAETVRFTIREW